MTGSVANAPMPRYRCHKEVWALKIKAVINAPPGSPDGMMSLEVDNGFLPINVSAEYMVKHKPEAGGYYVVYEDGYKSFSPAQAFELGYVKVSSHKDRVVAEKGDLDSLIAKLSSFMATRGGIFDDLPSAEKDRLTRQHAIMQKYSEVLGERIAAF